MPVGRSADVHNINIQAGEDLAEVTAGKNLAVVIFFSQLDALLHALRIRVAKCDQLGLCVVKVVGGVGDPAEADQRARQLIVELK